MTPKPTDVRMAKSGDEDLLFALVCTSGDEWSMGSQDTGKVRNVIGLATSTAPPPRPVFGVIPGKTMIEGAVGMFPTEPWNSSAPYIRVFFHYVHPDCRRSRHAVHLAEFAKWFGELTSMPVLFELLHPERTEAKARMYGRQATAIGGLYMHDVPAAPMQAAA